MARDARDWLFCPWSGSLLQYDEKRSAFVCAETGFKRTMADLESLRIVSRVNMEDYKRRYNLEPLVKSAYEQQVNEAVQRATTDEACPKCKNPTMEYYTKQLRSADEGQTIFYECPRCGHKFSQNT